MDTTIIKQVEKYKKRGFLFLTCKKHGVFGIEQDREDFSSLNYILVTEAKGINCAGFIHCF